MQLISQPIIHLNCEGAAAKSYGRRDFRSTKPDRTMGKGCELRSLSISLAS
jgi:hypothetical protein